MKKVTGFEWGFHHKGKHFTNTCSLDSFLVLLHAMQRSESLINNFAELDIPNSLLRRTFSLMDQNRWNDTRMLWMTGVRLNFDKTNLFGSVTWWFLLMAKTVTWTMCLHCTSHWWSVLADRPNVALSDETANRSIKEISEEKVDANKHF